MGRIAASGKPLPVFGDADDNADDHAYDDVDGDDDGVDDHDDGAYLIFVTDTRTVSVEKKSCHVEKFQISVHETCGES